MSTPDFIAGQADLRRQVRALLQRRVSAHDYKARTAAFPADTLAHHAASQALTEALREINSLALADDVLPATEPEMVLA